MELDWGWNKGAYPIPPGGEHVHEDDTWETPNLETPAQKGDGKANFVSAQEQIRSQQHARKLAERRPWQERPWNPSDPCYPPEEGSSNPAGWPEEQENPWGAPIVTPASESCESYRAFVAEETAAASESQVANAGGETADSQKAEDTTWTEAAPKEKRKKIDAEKESMEFAAARSYNPSGAVLKPLAPLPEDELSTTISSQSRGIYTKWAGEDEPDLLRRPGPVTSAPHSKQTKKWSWHAHRIKAAHDEQIIKFVTGGVLQGTAASFHCRRQRTPGG